MLLFKKDEMYKLGNRCINVCGGCANGIAHASVTKSKNKNNDDDYV